MVSSTKQTRKHNRVPPGNPSAKNKNKINVTDKHFNLPNHNRSSTAENNTKVCVSLLNDLKQVRLHYNIENNYSK